jgi:UDP-GlcNAc3NAcA epimerase
VKRIVTILGARPQFVKAAALSRVISQRNDIEEILVHTGQHYDSNMSEIFFQEMEIPKPAYNLGVNGGTHAVMTANMMTGIEAVLKAEQPDYVLVYGDTNSTLAAALTASKLHIPVVHIEAGLRSFNMRMPEELNRILTDRLSSILFCPTDTAIKNLVREGYPHINERIILSGDAMQDAAMYYSQFSSVKSDIISRYSLKRYLLVTIHRQENTDDEGRLRSIVAALNSLADSMDVLMPVHPRTQKMMESMNLNTQFRMIDPVGYFDMIELLKNCEMVLTDSGGLQKEAYFFHKVCLTLRDETEWVELVDGGFNILCGADENKILDSYMKLSEKDMDFSQPLYGGGKACELIAGILAE